MDTKGSETALVEFMRAMRECELACGKEDKAVQSGKKSAAQAEKAIRQLMNDVFTKYCSISSVPKRIKNAMHYAIGSEYDVKGEKVLSVSIKGRKAVITTKQGSLFPPTDYQYTLVQEDDGAWKLLDNKKRLSVNGKWVSWDL
jgi:hypothetical protein